MAIRVAILGLGSRGALAYGAELLADSRVQVVAGADADPAKLAKFCDSAGIDTQNRYADWRELLAQAPTLALDAVVIALPDDQHVDPLLAALEHDLAVLLEKPVATTEAELARLEAGIAQYEARGKQARVAVCHVLRETAFWRAIQQITSGGYVGNLLTIRHEENIGFWHFAHSFVRGIWRREDTTSPMILAKTCHDLDLIRWLAQADPHTVYSTGELTHFREENAPDGAPAQCTDGCPVAAHCAFYAPRFYEEAMAGVHDWPVSVISTDTSQPARRAALESGPYGRCVYRCDNTVVDHQQTVYTFPSGLTATLSTSALTGAITRRVQITGSTGQLNGEMETGIITLEIFTPGVTSIELPAFGTIVRTGTKGPLEHSVFEFQPQFPGADPLADAKGHGGGDARLVASFIAAVNSENFYAHISTGIDVSLASHHMAFGAERSRKLRTAIDLESGAPPANDLARK